MSKGPVLGMMQRRESRCEQTPDMVERRGGVEVCAMPNGEFLRETFVSAVLVYLSMRSGSGVRSLGSRLSKQVSTPMGLLPVHLPVYVVPSMKVS